MPLQINQLVILEHQKSHVIVTSITNGNTLPRGFSIVYTLIYSTNRANLARKSLIAIGNCSVNSRVCKSVELSFRNYIFCSCWCVDNVRNSFVRSIMDWQFTKNVYVNRAGLSSFQLVPVESESIIQLNKRNLQFAAEILYTWRLIFVHYIFSFPYDVY